MIKILNNVRKGWDLNYDYSVLFIHLPKMKFYHWSTWSKNKWYRKELYDHIVLAYAHTDLSLWDQIKLYHLSLYSRANHEFYWSTKVRERNLYGLSFAMWKSTESLSKNEVFDVHFASNQDFNFISYFLKYLLSIAHKISP